MKNVIEASELPHDEKVYLKKNIFGEYRIIMPIRNENGKLNKVNFLFGGWGNLFKLLFILFALFLFFFGVGEITEQCRDMAENPEKYFDIRKIGDYNVYNIPLEIGDLNG